MALGVAQLFAGVTGQTKRAKCNTLVETDIVTDNSSFSDDNSCPVIDEKTRADHCSRVYVNTGFTMGPFRHNAWYDRGV